jgi:hypothetical protein
MGRMTWDLATLEYHCWAGRAGWEADSDYTVDWRGRLWIRADMPRRTCSVAREALPCFQGHPSQPE